MSIPADAGEGHRKLAHYIVTWIRKRNGAEFESAIKKMSLGSYEDLHEELAHILANGGKPPNWF